MAWTNSEDEWLKENYPDMGQKYSAHMLGKTVGCVRSRASKLKLRINKTSDHFREWQQRAALSKVGKKRPDQAIVMKQLHEAGKLARSEESRRESGRKLGEYVRKNHPRGMLGRKHSPEFSEKASEQVKRRWKDPTSAFNSPEYRQRLSNNAANYQASKINREQDYSRCRRGKRKDIGDIFFRSMWEANYARYLSWQRQNGQIFSWEYEPGRFVFENVKRGVRSYTPDFKVRETEASDPYYIEIKGWMDEASKKRLEQMSLYYPAIRLIVIGSAEYSQLHRKFCDLIEGWEFPNQAPYKPEYPSLFSEFERV